MGGKEGGRKKDYLGLLGEKGAREGNEGRQEQCITTSVKMSQRN